MSHNSTQIPNLTPMRGIAAMLTVLFHIDLMLGNGGDTLVKIKDSLVLSKMYLMVDFFFILSGFIMVHVYGSWFAENVTGEKFKRFTIARFARVYPLHFVTLIATVFIFYISAKMGVPKEEILQVENHPFSFVTNLFLVHSLNFHTWFSWNHASWSISTEWWAYMIFPFLVAPISGLKAGGKIGVIGLCFLGYIMINKFLSPLVTFPPSLPFLKYDPNDNGINVGFQFGLVRCLCGFILGMVVYHLYKKEWLKNIASGGAILILVAIVFILMHFALSDIFVIAIFPLILLSGAYGSHNINRLLGSTPLQKIGDWSFSIYLVHQPLMFMLGAVMTYFNPIDPTIIPTGPPPKMDIFVAWAIALGFITIMLIVSYFTYTYVEKVSRNKINSWAG